MEDLFMENEVYTVGELAKIAGVSLKTIHFYDSKGLLKPVSYSKAGYRYYDRNSLFMLQRILMLKYLGFPLKEIAQMITERSSETNMANQLAHQKSLLIERKKHLEELIATIDIIENCDEQAQWNYLIKLLNMLTDDEKVVEQYQNAANLEKRINIHNYSTSKQDWAEWVFEKLELRSGYRILEIGCGTGRLWEKNIYQIPNNVTLVLSDRSEGMLKQAQSNLESFKETFLQKNIKVVYCLMDAECLELIDEDYDIIIANHMLYHVRNKSGCIKQIKKSLKKDGTFFCSTVGQSHMKELHELVRRFESRIEIPLEGLIIDFTLENGKKLLEKYFSNIVCEVHENNLLVDDVEAIYNYVYSYPGNAPCILDQRGEEFRTLLKSEMEKEGVIFIQKSTGMFICKN